MRDRPGSAAWEFASVRFLGPTTARDEVVTVATTPTRLLQNNPRRLFWLVVNRSVSAGAITFNPSAFSGRGLLLAPFGSSASMSVEEDGEQVSNELWATNETGAGFWWVFEVMRV